MSSTKTKGYIYNSIYYNSMSALVNELVEEGFVGDLEDLEYLMVYVSDITEDEAEDICDMIRDIYEDTYEDYEDDYIFDNNEEVL